MTRPAWNLTRRLVAVGAVSSVLVIPFLGRTDAEEPAVYRALFDRAEHGQFILDPQGHIRRANHSAERLFGSTEVQLRGRPFSELLAPGGPAMFGQALAATRGPRPESGPVTLEGRSPSGSVFPIAIEVLRVVHGTEERYGVIVRDGRGIAAGPRALQERFNPGQLLMATRIRELV